MIIVKLFRRNKCLNLCSSTITKQMKKQIALFAIVAAALVAAPAVLRAEDKPAKHEAGQEAAPGAKKKGVTPFHGNLASVDTAASTLTVGSTTINVTSETKITKNGKPATLADLTVGEKISGAYKKSEDGKNNATTVRVGDSPEKSEGKKPKKAEKE